MTLRWRGRAAALTLVCVTGVTAGARGAWVTHVGPVTGLPIYRTHPIAGVGKGRCVFLALHEQVPAHVVAVQVRHYHHINVCRPYTIGFEIVQKLAPGGFRSIHRFGPEPGINQNGPTIRPHQERASGARRR